MEKRSMFVGMDVHKESIDISVAEGGRQGEVRHYGVIAGDLEALAKVVRALRAPDRVLHFVDEAGPCGFGIHRDLTAQGEDCVVINPSSMPKRSGDRIKTDRRDGDALARLHRAGELTAMYIPTPAVVRYYTTHAHRMQYDDYLRRGYGIGSGAVESAHKQVVHARLRQAGMRWSVRGAQHVLALRALLLNGTWAQTDQLRCARRAA